MTSKGPDQTARMHRLLVNIWKSHAAAQLKNASNIRYENNAMNDLSVMMGT